MKTTVPDVLYHYTSLDGLIGVLRSQALWATDIRYLNDAAEFEYAFKLAEATVLSMPRGASGAYGSFLDPYREAVSRAIGKRTYVASLTVRGDQLGQWRAYALPSGAAIGFNAHELQDVAKDRDFELHPCIYDQSTQRVKLEEMFDGSPSPEEFAENLLQLAPLFKAPQFEEEDEWRLVSRSEINHRTVEYRASSRMLVPYVSIDLNPGGTILPVEEIVAGPSPHVELNVAAIERLLRSGPTYNCSVKQSRVPYRSW